jgi:N-acetylglucosaminyldiphosphoundecaprenol N-acetyl-beta-D-mannosaminyltransferase
MTTLDSIGLTSTSPRGGTNNEDSRALQQLERADVLGCRIDRVDFDQALAACGAVIQERGFAQHMAINVAKLMAMRDNAALRESIERCELVTADGQPVVWAARLLRDPLPSRVAGIDLMHGLLERAAVTGYRVYILGAKAEILETAVARIRTRFPGIVVAGYRDGYYDDRDEDAVAASIVEARPDILFVAMSSPRKEYFLARHGQTIGVPLVMGVGGAIDVVAGVTRRAPVVLQQLGLEWLFRLVQEPRRLARRYFATNLRFILLLSREVMKRVISPALTSRGAGGPGSQAGDFGGEGRGDRARDAA